MALTTSVEFSVLGALADRRAASPTMRLRIGVRVDGPRVDAMALQVQVRIMTGHGRELEWSQNALLVDGFSGESAFDVPIPCTYDLRVASSRYLASLDGAPIPVRLMFNGTIFRDGTAERLPHAECEMHLSQEVWRETMDACFPDHAWIRVNRETFDALRHYAVQNELFGSSEVIGDLFKRLELERRA